MQYSTRIYNIYLKWFAPEDVYVYSVDEVFINVTNYLNTYHMSARELATKVVQNVFDETGITATCGIGTNLYLCKVAMDIVAKHMQPNQNGVRIAGLDELTYRKFLWSYQPLTAFWGIGHGYAKKLASRGIETMGDLARMSLQNEELLYKLFGVHAEILIDHAWGYEPCTIESIKSYQPVSNSVSSGQVLKRPYAYEETKLIVKEMAELLSLDLVQKNLVTSQLVLTLGYDIENLKNNEIAKAYQGEITYNHYGKMVPKHAHGTIHLNHKTASTKLITQKMVELYEHISNQNLLVRRINMTACEVESEVSYINQKRYEQVDLFTDYQKVLAEEQKEKTEKNLQKAVLEMKEKYGKNAILKGMNFVSSGTTIERNGQVGGHRS